MSNSTNELNILCDFIENEINIYLYIYLLVAIVTSCKTHLTWFDDSDFQFLISRELGSYRASGRSPSQDKDVVIVGRGCRRVRQTTGQRSHGEASGRSRQTTREHAQREHNNAEVSGIHELRFCVNVPTVRWLVSTIKNSEFYAIRNAFSTGMIVVRDECGCASNCIRVPLTRYAKTSSIYSRRRIGPPEYARHASHVTRLVSPVRWRRDDSPRWLPISPRTVSTALDSGRQGYMCDRNAWPLFREVVRTKRYNNNVSDHTNSCYLYC